MVPFENEKVQTQKVKQSKSYQQTPNAAYLKQEISLKKTNGVGLKKRKKSTCT